MTINILAVCTGNICRSPIAEGLLRVGVRVVGLDARVASAGTIPGGRPADPHAVAVMADRGIDISGHRSHEVTAIDIDAADLILAMAREHVVAVAGLVPPAFEKTFAIKPFVARARDVGPKSPELALERWLAEVGEGRSHADLLRQQPDHDIGDPLGQGRRAFDRVATELEALSWAALDLLTGYPPRT